MGHHAGPLDRARPLRAAARLGHLQDPCHGLGDRRRLRRQDGRLPRAAGAGAVQEVAQGREDGDEPRRGVPRLRPDLWRQRVGQDRRQEERQDRRRRGDPEVSGRRVPGLARAAGLHVRVRALRPRACEGRRLRRGDQPPEGGGLSRTGRPDLGVCRRERGGRAVRAPRHRSDRAAPQERGQGRHQGRLRAEVRSHRPHRGPEGRAGQPTLEGAAGQEPGTRHRRRLLVQHRRRDHGVAAAQRGRHAELDGGHARHRRLARLACA